MRNALSLEVNSDLLNKSVCGASLLEMSFTLLPVKEFQVTASFLNHQISKLMRILMRNSDFQAVKNQMANQETSN